MNNTDTYQEYTPLVRTLPPTSDAPVRDDLRRLGYVDLRQFVADDANVRTDRSRIRYLAALLPTLTVPELAQAIHGIISNGDLSLSDMRIILEGRRLNDASKLTGEVPITAIQKVGEVLMTGGNLTAAARQAGVSVDTVAAIDEYLELTQSYEDHLMDQAVAAVRDGWSVRHLAKVSGMSKSRAHRYIERARSVLAEIGELS